MSNEEPKWIEGLKIFSPHEKAPDFVKAELVCDVEQFYDYGRRHHAGGEIRITVKLSKGGQLWLERDDWRPAPQEYNPAPAPPPPPNVPQRAPKPPSAPNPPPMPQAPPPVEAGDESLEELPF